MLEKATPDLFLLDVAMPGMDGVELCRRIRASARTYQTPVIFLSATGDSQTIDRSLAAGGTDYLRKLPSREILVSTINKVLGENGQRSRRRASE
jgi:putative two-component system response regulator